MFYIPYMMRQFATLNDAWIFKLEFNISRELRGLFDFLCAGLHYGHKT